MTQDCSATWRDLPLANVVPANTWAPGAAAYWSNEVLPQLIPAIVFCSLAAALLLGFIAWRLARCCGARCSVRRSRNRSEVAGTAGGASDGGSSGERRKKRRRQRSDPLDVLHGRAYWAIKICAVLLMGGVIAGAALGIAAVDPPLVRDGRVAFNSMKDYINSAVQAANATVAQLQMLDSWALGVQVKLNTLNVSAAVVTAVDQTIQNVHDTVQGSLDGVRSAMGYIQVHVSDRIAMYELEWGTTVTIIDFTRQGALFAMYGLLIGFVVLLAAGILANMPGLANPSLVLCLVFLVVAWALVGTSTAALKVGNDGCQNIEQLLTTAVQNVALDQMRSGGGIFANAGVNNTVALVHYFLTGQGKNVTDIIQETTGLNIDKLLALVNNTASSVQELVSKRVTNPQLVAQVPGLAILQAPVAQIVAGVQALVANVTSLENLLSYTSFGPIWHRLEGWACCDALNWVGAQWTALLVAGCCLVVLVALAFWWVARMDRLEARGCWHVYRLRDYSAMEDEEGGAGPPLPLPELPSLKHTSEDKDIALSSSITAKQQAAAARAAKGSDAAAAAVDDDFSLRALVPPPAPHPPPSSEDVQLLSARNTPLPPSSARVNGGGSSMPGDAGGSSSSATTPRGLQSVPPFSSFSSESWQISPTRSRRGGWSQWNTPRGKGGA